MKLKAHTGSASTLTAGAAVQSGGKGSRSQARYANVPPPPEAIPFPHAARIEAATNSSVAGNAVVDPSACAERNVEAFTDNDTLCHGFAVASRRGP